MFKYKVILFGIIGGVIGIICVGQILPMIDYQDTCCSICESYWAYGALEDEEDNVMDECGGVYIALGELWRDYNLGKGSHRTQSHLDYLESMRLKNGDKGRSFALINLSNPCPISPSKIYLGTGYIYEFIPYSYDGPAYSITRMSLNGTNWTFSNCGWHPYPYNKSCLTHVFRAKGNAWWNSCKHAELYDASLYPTLPDDVNQSWVEWEVKYQLYLEKGGVDVGDQY